MVNNHWLVVWNMNFMDDFSIYWECHHPNWLSHIFQRGQPPTIAPRTPRPCSFWRWPRRAWPRRVNAAVKRMVLMPKKVGKTRIYMDFLGFRPFHGDIMGFNGFVKEIWFNLLTIDYEVLLQPFATYCSILCRSEWQTNVFRQSSKLRHVDIESQAPSAPRLQ